MKISPWTVGLQPGSLIVLPDTCSQAGTVLSKWLQGTHLSRMISQEGGSPSQRGTEQRKRKAQDGGNGAPGQRHGKVPGIQLCARFGNRLDRKDGERGGQSQGGKRRRRMENGGWTVWNCAGALGEMISMHLPDVLEHLERVSDKCVKKTKQMEKWGSNSKNNKKKWCEIGNVIKLCCLTHLWKSFHILS